MDDKVTIKFAPSDKIKEMRPWVDQVLKAIGHETALVTNESRLGDFPLESSDYTHLEEDLGFPVTAGERVIEVAVKLRDFIKRP